VRTTPRSPSERFHVRVNELVETRITRLVSPPPCGGTTRPKACRSRCLQPTCSVFKRRAPVPRAAAAQDPLLGTRSGPGGSRHPAHAGGLRVRGWGVFFPRPEGATEPAVPRRPRWPLPAEATSYLRRPSPLCWPPRDRGIQRRRARTPSIDKLPRGDRTIRRLGHRLLRHTVFVTPSHRSPLGRGDSLTACTPPDRTPLVDIYNPHDPRTHPRALAPARTAGKRRRRNAVFGSRTRGDRPLSPCPRSRPRHPRREYASK